MTDNESTGADAPRDFASGIVNASSDAEDLRLIANAIGNENAPMAINVLPGGQEPDPARDREVRINNALRYLQTAKLDMNAAALPRATEQFRTWSFMTTRELVNKAIDELEGRITPSFFPTEDDGHPMPKNERDFVEWASCNWMRVFKCTFDPVSLKAIKTRRIPGLKTFAAEGFGGQLHAAWTDAGRFVGWMHFCPSLSRIDHDFAIGEIQNEPVWPDNHMHAIRRKPLTTWYDALRVAAVRMGAV